MSMVVFERVKLGSVNSIHNVRDIYKIVMDIMIFLSRRPSAAMGFDHKK
jgi:hypothetical protein